MIQHTKLIYRFPMAAVVDKMIAAIGLLMVVALIFTFAACESEDGGGSELVTIMVAAPQEETATTRAVNSGNESTVQDLLVLIFNNKGEIIGYTYGSYSIASGKTVAVSVKTRRATGCTVYVVANAGTSSGMGAFSSVRTKAAFDALYASVSSPDALGNANSLLMFGKITNFSTTSKGTVSLRRLAAKAELNIVVGPDITLDSYQLCHAPLSAYYVDTRSAVTASPKRYGNFSEKKAEVTGKAVTATYYLYESLVGKGTNKIADGWRGRYAYYAPANATYLVIKAHTASWKSTYYVYLGGKTLSSATNTSYDYTDYTIYRNTDYKVTVTLSGGGSAEDGYRVDYDARVLMTGNTLQVWTSGSANINM